MVRVTMGLNTIRSFAAKSHPPSSPGRPIMVRPVDYNATTTIYDNLNVKKTAEGQYYPAQLEQTR